MSDLPVFTAAGKILLCTDTLASRCCDGSSPHKPPEHDPPFDPIDCDYMYQLVAVAVESSGTAWCGHQASCVGPRFGTIWADIPPAIWVCRGGTYGAQDAAKECLARGYVGNLNFDTGDVTKPCGGCAGSGKWLFLTEPIYASGGTSPHFHVAFRFEDCPDTGESYDDGIVILYLDYLGRATHPEPQEEPA